MELKQWLYNHGDECEHNTGGWMKCKNGASAGNFGASASQSIMFASDEILIKQALSAPAPYDGTYYHRGAASVNSNVGTMKGITDSGYKLLYVISTQAITTTIRTGSPNTETMDISSATIMVSSKDYPLEIITNAELVYLILGCIVSYEQVASLNRINGISYSLDAHITEIYLV